MSREFRTDDWDAYTMTYDDPHVRIEELADDVPIREREGTGRKWVIIETPHGDLERELELTVDQTWRTVGFPVKGVEDLKGLRWLFDRIVYRFSAENFAEGDAFVGDRGIPQFWVPKSPYQALVQQWMTLPDLIYALVDHPVLVSEVMRAIDDSYDRLYEEMVGHGGLQIVNFGENIHEQLLSPRYFKNLLGYLADLPSAAG